MTSKYVTFEWSFALALRLPLILLQLEETKSELIHPRLATHQKIDFTIARSWEPFLAAITEITPKIDSVNERLINAVEELIVDGVLSISDLNIFLQHKVLTSFDILDLTKRTKKNK